MLYKNIFLFSSKTLYLKLNSHTVSLVVTAHLGLGLGVDMRKIGPPQYPCMHMHTGMGNSCFEVLGHHCSSKLSLSRGGFWEEKGVVILTITSWEPAQVLSGSCIASRQAICGPGGGQHQKQCYWSPWKRNSCLSSAQRSSERWHRSWTSSKCQHPGTSGFKNAPWDRCSKSLDTCSLLLRRGFRWAPSWTSSVSKRIRHWAAWV
jgi:hypothetical protein